MLANRRSGRRETVLVERKLVMMSANFLSRQFFCSLAVIFGLSVVLGVLPKGTLAQPTPGASPMKIGVIGSGNIGSAVGTLWVKAGHQVLFSSRHPENLKQLVDGLGPLARAGTVDEALKLRRGRCSSACRTALTRKLPRIMANNSPARSCSTPAMRFWPATGKLASSSGEWRCAHLGEVVRRRAHRPRLQHLELS